MMQGIQHFFSGFILLKVPFPLTVGFKNMFQRGVAPMPDLEPAYVSSVSWYFLVLYGLRSFFKLITGNPPLEQREQDMLLTRMGYQNPPNPTANKQNADALAKSLRTEADNLELHQVKSELDGAEKRLLGKRFPKRKVKSKGNADFLLGKKKSSKKKQ
jgi:ER membrane protein complex subunit 3